jgi:hypothetical protein
MVALALQLRSLATKSGFAPSLTSASGSTILGFRFGPEVGQTAARPSAAQAPPAPVQLRQLMEDTVAGQFEAITAAARG